MQLRPISNCPGRFVLDDAPADLHPRALLGEDIELREFRVPAARDVVIVARLEDEGGLISYRRADGTYVHTLNTRDGFARKLLQLGIALDAVA